ncbi:MAG: carbohydrate ABC transporter permease [Spirochaetes bacterium]|nr:MAG: carbohydrate ABC transporter permease [Spirochaetota bacterium]
MRQPRSDFILFYLFCTFFILLIGFPFFWQITNSLKIEKEIFELRWMPSRIILNNYKEAFIRQPLLKFLFNSSIISSGATVLALLFGSMAAYSLARTDIRGKRLILLIILSVSLLPPIVIINPIYSIIRSLKLLNSHFGLMMVDTLFGLTISVWFLTPYFQSVPMDLEESAFIDGASPFLSFRKIIIPIVTPGIFTVGILVFIKAWNDFLFALVLNPIRARTVTVGLKLYESDNYIPWGTLMAASVVIVVPLIVVVLLLQKRIIGGLMEGGLKE